MTILFSMEHEIKNKTEGKKTRFLQLPKNILRIAWRFGVFCITLQRHPEDCDVSRPAWGLADIDGILMLAKSFVWLTGGRGKAFTDVTTCVFKLRNFESFHRSNATVDVCVGELYPDLDFTMLCVVVVKRFLHIISLGVGWLRCLSLEWGNAKAWRQGWAKVRISHAFFVSIHFHV